MLFSTEPAALKGYAASKISASAPFVKSLFVYSPSGSLKAGLLSEHVDKAREYGGAEVLFVSSGSSFIQFDPVHGRGTIDLCEELRRLGLRITFVLCPANRKAREQLRGNPTDLELRRLVQGAAEQDTVKVWEGFDADATLPAGCALVDVSERAPEISPEVVRPTEQPARCTGRPGWKWEWLVIVLLVLAQGRQEQRFAQLAEVRECTVLKAEVTDLQDKVRECIGLKAEVRECTGLKAEVRECTGLKAEVRECTGLKAEVRECTGLKAEVRECTGLKAEVRECSGLKAKVNELEAEVAQSKFNVTPASIQREVCPEGSQHLTVSDRHRPFVQAPDRSGGVLSDLRMPGQKVLAAKPQPSVPAQAVMRDVDGPSLGAILVAMVVCASTCGHSRCTP